MPALLQPKNEFVLKFVRTSGSKKRLVNKGKCRQLRIKAGVVVTSLADDAGSLNTVGAYATVMYE